MPLTTVSKKHHGMGPMFPGAQETSTAPEICGALGSVLVCRIFFLLGLHL